MTTAAGMQGMGHILGQAEKDFQQKQPETGPSSEMDRHAFLKLLITQLEHQDPTEPMKDEDFVAQLAQFTSLEKLTSIADGVDTLNAENAHQQMLEASNFLGKEIKAEGREISKNGEDTSTLYYSPEKQTVTTYLNLFGANDQLIRTVQLGAKQAGEHTFEWDGLNYQGTEMPDGVYAIGIQAEGVNGEPVKVDTKVTGRVAGVEAKDGSVSLSLENGRAIDWKNVQSLTDTAE